MKQSTTYKKHKDIYRNLKQDPVLIQWTFIKRVKFEQKFETIHLGLIRNSN